MPQPTQAIEIEVSDELAEDFAWYAQKTGRTVSDVIEEALRLYLLTCNQGNAALKNPSQDRHA